MPQSIALIIVNAGKHRRDNLRVIKEAFHRLNIAMTILIDKSNQEICSEFEKLSAIDDSQVNDVICVVLGSGKGGKLSTIDGTLDLYEDIIFPLMCVEAFAEKNKIVIISGIIHDIILNVDSASKKPYCNGKNVAIVSSLEENFIETFIPKLVLFRGDLEVARDECGFCMPYTSTVAFMKLSITSSETLQKASCRDLVV